jgi:hypothetical protein
MRETGLMLTGGSSVGDQLVADASRRLSTGDLVGAAAASGFDERKGSPSMRGHRLQHATGERNVRQLITTCGRTARPHGGKQRTEPMAQFRIIGTPPNRLRRGKQAGTATFGIDVRRSPACSPVS